MSAMTMLRNTKQIKGRSLHAVDGVIGEVKDIYFDDQDWHVRYLVIETGAWLKKRKVLISPGVLGALDWGRNDFPCDLTMEQVRNSPNVDTDKPVTRQQESALRQYYGWPPYWGAVFVGEGLTAPISAPTPSDERSERELTDGNAPLRRRADPYLRSANDTINYHIAASDGPIGHLEDFLIDDVAWWVRYLVIDTRNWLSGRRVVVAPDWIRTVDWHTRTVHVDLTRDAIKASPAYDAAAPWNPTYAAELHDYYRQPRYADWEKDVAGASKPSKSNR
jgi:hypothetical protein